MPDFRLTVQHRTVPDVVGWYDEACSPPLGPLARRGGLAAQVTVVTAEDGGRPAGVAVGQRLPDGVGETLRVFVAPEMRRQGIGRALLGGLERALAGAGCTVAQGTVRTDWPGAEAALALLAAAGWEPPREQKRYYKIRGMAFMGQPVMQHVTVPEGYTITDWDALTASGRAHVEALVAADPATAPLSPFQNPAAVSPEFSVWLWHGGAVVGWHLVLVPSPPVVEYAGLYVTPEHRKGRAGLALVAASGRRHIAAVLERGDARFGPEARAVSVFAVEPQSREMRAFADAYFRRDGITETTVWLAGKRLGAA